MSYFEVIGMWRLWRCAGLLTILTGLLGAAPRHLVWQTGLVRIDPEVQVEPAGYAGARLRPPSQLQGPESEPLPDSQIVFLHVYLTIDSAQGTYTVEHRVISPLPAFLLADAPTGEQARDVGAPQQILPWLAHLPSPVSFAIQGKSLYYRDARGKLHKASLLP